MMNGALAAALFIPPLTPYLPQTVMSRAGLVFCSTSASGSPHDVSKITRKGGERPARTPCPDVPADHEPISANDPDGLTDP